MLDLWKGKGQKTDDTVMDRSEVRSNDLIIPIVGLTGIGKSTFINTVAGREDATVVGHDLESCTTKIHHVIVPHPEDPSRRIIFVDTPGFDDTYEADSKILQRVSVWLARSYGDEMRLAGVIYLQDITQTPIFGTSPTNLMMFEKLCGNEGIGGVILATTKWENLPDGIAGGAKYEDQLKGIFWREMVERGSQVARFDGSQSSAREIVDRIIENHDYHLTLRVQTELVDLGKLIPETEAGITLRTMLKKLIETRKETVMQLKNEENGPGSEDLRRRLRETEAQLQLLLKQIQDLKVPLGARVKSWFGVDLRSDRDNSLQSVPGQPKSKGGTALSQERTRKIGNSSLETVERTSINKAPAKEEATAPESKFPGADVTNTPNVITNDGGPVWYTAVQSDTQENPRATHLHEYTPHNDLPTNPSISRPNDALGESNPPISRETTDDRLDTNKSQMPETMWNYGGTRTGIEMICPRLYMYILMLLESYVPSQVDSLRAMYSEWDGDEIAQIIHYDSIMTTLRGYLDRCEVEYHGSSDPALVNRILKLDALSLATRIRVVSKDRQRRKLLVNLKESQAQSLLDLLQELLDSFDLGDIRSSLVRTMVELSKNSGLYPTRLILRNLTIPGGLPSAGGAFGDVFTGDLGGQVVAVKMMRVFGAPAVESLTKAYSKEAVLWAQLSSPYVLPFCGVYNMAEPSPRMCLVSPWMGHGSLPQYLEKNSQANRLSLMLDVALGLAYLHSFDPPVIHGDLKGANILITADLTACVADFGLCVLAQDSNWQVTVASSSNGKGSTPWMAPELFNVGGGEQKRKTCASDIYALGCVGYEIFSGKPPFSHLSPPMVMLVIMNNHPLPRPASAELDDVIWGLIEACRSVDPESRPKASEVVRRLRSHPTICERKELVWDQSKSISWRLLSTLTSASLAAPASEGDSGDLRGPHFVYHRRNTAGPSSA
ncbi:hypothetical protein BV22DRAFT_1035939 [Leucogyrophana mollusca]|uniref:Uncharacterized protein n=1 Tax=Leucogyrophana mollusca TaxID=85980 RepID=A0ACB8BDI2_9AGAM|nr:hypothetical protein BV22DRAFT_1035939 [Leucogyrophana mollusca]